MLDLLVILKDDAVALVDTIAPTDFVLRSPLGKCDGEIYKNLYSTLVQTPEVFERAKWWQDVTHFQSYIKPKL